MVYIVRIKNGKKEIEDFRGFPLPDPREDKTIVLITADSERAERFGESHISAKQWRELGADDTLKSIEVATSVLKDFLKGEALDDVSTLGRIMQLIDLSAVFQEMAMSVLKGVEEKWRTYAKHPLWKK
ncbi:hypothetical protein ES703_31924 [subsurface metagenome]